MISQMLLAGVHIYIWAAFLLGVFIMLAIDIGVFHKKVHALSLKEATGWTITWIALAMIFNAVIFLWRGVDDGLTFFAAYLTEESLSIDNIFVFVTIFSYFKVKPQYQHRVLFFGILGAIILRGIFILVGIALIAKFHWVLYIFGAVLMLTGIKLMFKSESVDVENNPILKLCRKLLPVTTKYHEQKFIIKKMGIRLFTPMFLVLIAIETTDVIFAFDSIPAVFGITRDPFIAFTSNIMAILGLRALYFVVASLVTKFKYLNIGISVILIFIGVKMLIEDFYKIEIAHSLIFICFAITISILASIRR